MVKNILIWFEACSILRVNTKKFVLYQVSKVHKWSLITKIWGCKQGAFLDVYLGLPIGAKYQCLLVWDPL